MKNKTLTIFILFAVIILLGCPTEPGTVAPASVLLGSETITVETGSGVTAQQAIDAVAVVKSAFDNFAHKSHLAGKITKVVITTDATGLAGTILNVNINATTGNITAIYTGIVTCDESEKLGIDEDCPCGKPICNNEPHVYGNVANNTISVYRKGTVDETVIEDIIAAINNRFDNIWDEYQQANFAYWASNGIYITAGDNSDNNRDTEARILTIGSASTIPQRSSFLNSVANTDSWY